jgi:hypothetical protein
MNSRSQQRSEFCVVGAIAIAVLAFALDLDRLHAQTPAAQVQICVGPTNSAVTGAVTGCAPVNLAWGPLTVSSLTRTVVNGKQTWLPFSQLTPGSVVMVKGIGWQPLSSVKITIPGVAAAQPPQPPVHDYSKITGFLVEHSPDGGASWESVAAWRVTSGLSVQCFKITPQEGTALGPVNIVCPIP